MLEEGSKLTEHVYWKPLYRKKNWGYILIANDLYL
jgi:hypothetical protein